MRVPPTIQALLAARLDQLDANERAVIERAAVGGKVFYEGAVADLAPADLRPAVPDALASLVRKDLIRPDQLSLGEPTYHFRHLLIRDAAYESIPKEARAELHERFGRWLDHAAGERAIEHEEVVGYHLEQAYRYLTELGPRDDTSPSDRARGGRAARQRGTTGIRPQRRPGRGEPDLAGRGAPAARGSAARRARSQRPRRPGPRRRDDMG